MHILYLDDSGSERNPGEDYVVLGGIMGQFIDYPTSMLNIQNASAPLV
jgi:hypothetical protein